MKLLGRGISLLALLLVVVSVDVRPAAGKTEEGLATSVTIFRDTYGVPHVDAPTDAGVLYGWAYAQAEDYFWQVEDSYIMALGRYAEVQGEDGLENDLLNRTFDVVPRARAAYDLLDSEMRTLVAAFTAGLNGYLRNHPEEMPRLIEVFEPLPSVSWS